MNRNRLLNWRHGVLAAGLALSFGVAGAGAGPITTSPFGEDLDGDDNDEVAGSYAKQTFLPNPSGGTVSFSYMFLTSEAGRSSSVHDLFRIQLRPKGDANNPVPNRAADGNPPSQVDGAVVRDGDAYQGGYAEYDFAADTINGTDSGVDAENSAITIPAGGGLELSHETVLTNGGIGWQTVSFQYSSEAAKNADFLTLEFLVAGSDDWNYDSALFISDVMGAGYIGNGLFADEEGNPSDLEWSFEGNSGVYDEIATDDGGTVTSPSGDGNIAVLSTSNTTTVPEPSTGVLLLGLAGLAATGRRRRR